MKDRVKLNQMLKISALSVMAAPLLLGCSGSRRNDNAIIDPRYQQYYGGLRTAPLGSTASGSGRTVERVRGAQVDRSPIRERSSVADLLRRGGSACLSNTGGCTVQVVCVDERMAFADDGKMYVVDGCKKGERRTARTGDTEDSPRTASGDREQRDDQGPPTLTDRKPDWEVACQNEKIDDETDVGDEDGIPDVCERTLSAKGKFPALNEKIFNGYRVSAIHLDDNLIQGVYQKLASISSERIGPATAEESAAGNIAEQKKANWWEKTFLGRRDLNERIANFFIQLEQRGQSSIHSVKALYDAASTGEYYLNSQFAGRGIESDKAVVVRGGSGDEAVGYSPNNFSSSNFNVGQLTGVGSNFSSLSERDKFMYVAEAYVKVTKNGATLRLARTAGGGQLDDNVAGAFLVFVDGNLEISSVGLKGTRGRVSKILNNVDRRPTGSIPVGGWRHLVVAMIGQQAKDDNEARQLIRENVFVDLHNGSGYQLLPQEIARPLRPSEKRLANSDVEIIDGVTASASVSSETVGDNTDVRGEREDRKPPRRRTATQTTTRNGRGGGAGRSDGTVGWVKGQRSAPSITEEE